MSGNERTDAVTKVMGADCFTNKLAVFDNLYSYIIKLEYTGSFELGSNLACHVHMQHLL